MNLESFKKKFSQEGLSFTAQRRAIAEVILKADDHPEIDEIFFRVRLVDKTASIATVYRTINLFTELGLLAKRDFKDNKARYEWRGEKDHNHIILESGEIIEFTSPELEMLIKKIATEHNLDLKDYTLELYCEKK